jgi:hypothetical protein
MVKVYNVMYVDLYEHGRSYVLSVWDNEKDAKGECERLNLGNDPDCEYHEVIPYELNKSNGRIHTSA